MILYIENPEDPLKMLKLVNGLSNFAGYKNTQIKWVNQFINQLTNFLPHFFSIYIAVYICLREPNMISWKSFS